MDMVLEFERPLVELKKRIQTLQDMQEADGLDLSASISQLQVQAVRLQEQIFSDLSRWQRTQLSRHPHRPYTLDYVKGLFTGFRELKGDRAGHEDAAIVCGQAWFGETPVMVMGHQKGRNTKENLRHNFGMAKPEGYRKALRLMQLANRFGRPIICFIDTSGAFPGIEAEARGQAEAIARNIMEMSVLTVPIICVVIGEGGSGGALAVGVGNRVLMMENAVYSVISPEGCAAILWRDRAEAPTAAEALRVTAEDCLGFGVADEIVAEPPGGAHRDHETAIASLGEALGRHLEALSKMSPQEVKDDRYARFRKLGGHLEPS